MATVEAIKALGAGEKLAMGRSVYCRRNRGGGYSFILRRKINEKSKDDVVYSADVITKAEINAAISAAEKKRSEKVEPKASAKPQAAAQEPNTLGEVWADFLAGVEWSERNEATNVNRVRKYLERSELWNRPIASITSRECSDLLAPIRNATPMQYRKIVGLMNQIFVQGVGLGLMESSPMALAQKLLANRGKISAGKHHPALMDWQALRDLVKQLLNSRGEPSVRNALFLQCLTAQRTSEVMGAQWSEFNLDAEVPTWKIPRSRMKITDDRRDDHVLHLSHQCVAWLRSLPKNESTLVFPSNRGDGTAMLSSEALSKHMRETLGMRDKHVPHSWRASLKTLATRATKEDGSPRFTREWVESVLDHISADQIEAAYQRGGHAAEGGRVLQWWSDQLLG